MRAHVGIDHRGYYKQAARLLARLDFAGLEVSAVHVVEEVGRAALRNLLPVPPPVEALSPAEERMRTEGNRLLVEANSDLEQRGLAPSTQILRGSVANRLMENADADDADLLVLGSYAKGRLEAIVTGSVASKVIVAARQSILLAKSEIEDSGPLTALLATDHSEYANRAIDLLVRFAPRGLGRLVVASVCPPGTPPDLRAAIDQQNATVMGRCESLGCSLESLVAEGRPKEEIRHLIKAANAQLLILGAKGHGVLDRINVGSVSLHHALCETYPVLILRAR